jgi:hypothetical protein
MYVLPVFVACSLVGLTTVPQRLKPQIHLHLAARLEGAPFQSLSRPSIDIDPVFPTDYVSGFIDCDSTVWLTVLEIERSIEHDRDGNLLRL